MFKSFIYGKINENEATKGIDQTLKSHDSFADVGQMGMWIVDIEFFALLV